MMERTKSWDFASLQYVLGDISDICYKNPLEAISCWLDSLAEYEDKILPTEMELEDYFFDNFHYAGGGFWRNDWREKEQEREE